MCARERSRSACRVMRASALAAALAAVVTLLPGHVRAHAFLDRAEPRVGSRVKTSPREVRLIFTERLEPAFSSVRVVAESGEQVDRRDARVDDSDPTVLRVSIDALSPGKYKVIWRVLSVDTHVTEGDFTFRIAP